MRVRWSPWSPVPGWDENSICPTLWFRAHCPPAQDAGDVILSTSSSQQPWLGYPERIKMNGPAYWPWVMGPSKTQSIRQIHQLWDIIPRASSTVSAFLTFIRKWLHDKRIQFVFWIQGEKIFLIKLFCFVAIHHFLPKCKTKPLSFPPSLFKTFIMIDFYCIFFQSMNEFFKPNFGCCLLTTPWAFKESFFAQKAVCRSRQTGKEVVWVNNESWASLPWWRVWGWMNGIGLRTFTRQPPSLLSLACYASC